MLRAGRAAARITTHSLRLHAAPRGAAAAERHRTRRAARSLPQNASALLTFAAHTWRCAQHTLRRA